PFESSPLSRALYRGCRFEGVTTLGEQIDATIEMARTPGRLVFTYLASVDFAAHVHGQVGEAYDDAIAAADTLWSTLATRLPAHVGLVGTADHGHVDFPVERRFRIPNEDHDDRTFYGDGRAMFVRGDGAALAASLPATWVPFEEAAEWWGPGPLHAAFEARRPDGILLADQGDLLLHRYSDRRLIGNHGGLTPEERRVPLLVPAAG
ncbi:MAG: alkaline phosphatase family protein, partial [Acidimicrobiia bacterium]